MDIPGILAGLYRSTLVDLKAVMNRLMIGLSNVAKGEILSVNPNVTNATKKTPNIGMTLSGALRDVCSWSTPAQDQRSKESAARANIQGRVKTYIECTILKNIEDKELQRIILTASRAFGQGCIIFPQIEFFLRRYFRDSVFFSENWPGSAFSETK